MGGAHRKSTRFSPPRSFSGALRAPAALVPLANAVRNVPALLRSREKQAAIRTVRASIAVGTALTLVTGSGLARADAGQAVAALHGSASGVPTRDTGNAPGRSALNRPPVAIDLPDGVDGPAISATFTLRRAGRPTADAGRRPGASARPATTPARPTTDPALARIARESAAAEAVAEQLTDAREALPPLTAAQATAASTLAAARATTAAAASDAEAWARESFIAEASRPEGLAVDPRAAMLGRPKLGTAVLSLEAAEAHERAAADAARRADERLAAQQSRVDALRRNLTARGEALRRLRAARASALAAAERRRDAVEAALARRYLRDAKGAAGKAAISAVEYALAQRGKPYEWGAEGPDRFDCSGLVQTAYASSDVLLPRTARPQYRASRPVPITALLPGDLLFFATDRADWNTIHHVGVYLGRGLMVHAPTTGDVVRVAPVWWSEFFSAGRVVPGRPQDRASEPSPRASKPTPSPTVLRPRTAPPADQSRRASATPRASGTPSSSPESTGAGRRTSGAPATSGSPRASGSPTGASRRTSGSPTSSASTPGRAGSPRASERGTAPRSAKASGTPGRSADARRNLRSAAPTRPAAPSGSRRSSTERSSAATLGDHR
ncbi:C40 family peptidase [Cryptosporangium minutisporangium]|uniref:NlpC/P60 domain-containing protein n=1 Tax=Cryptosporangium minutisporangium TaxID=113569 RepID=A0ABP6T7X6_9ACTN